MSTTTQSQIDSIVKGMKDANAFGSVRVDGSLIEAEAWGSAEPAWYRIYLDQNPPIVELATKDRWLSESIESELVESSDKLDELIEDELVDLGYEPGEGREVRFEHYRNDDLEFVFRSRVVPNPSQDMSDACLLWVRAYEQCFRNLGDMDNSDDED